MATLDQKFEAFRAKYDLTEEATTEMLAIFNETFIELAHKLLSNQEIATPMSTTTNVKQMAPRKNNTTEKSSGVKKFATKIAAEYAAERGFTLDDFDKEKITKKDIDELSKNGKPNTNASTSESASASADIPEEPEKTIPKLMTEMCSDIKTTKKKTVQKCHAANRDGTPCDKRGEQKPENCNNYYCFRHALDWKKYEVSSDSELEEEEIIFKDLAIATED